MPKNPALITPQILVWARNRLQMPPEIVAKAAKVALNTYLDWEKGEQLPTINQAKDLAKKLKIPYAWLFLPVPPEKFKLPKNSDYRTLTNKTTPEYSLDLQYLLNDISIRRDVMIELYTEMGIPVPRFEQYIDRNAENASIAQAVRNLLKITTEVQKNFKNSNAALNYYMETLSSAGILVFQTGKLDENIMRGMSIYEPLFPIIVLNRKDECNARIFTLLHELVHILTRTPGICDTFHFGQSPFEIEIKCNKVAAEALIPQDALIQDECWQQIEKSGLNDDVIKKIAKNFSVSREVVIGRLFTLGKINFDFYNKKLAQYIKEYKQYKYDQTEKNHGFLHPNKDICSQVGKLYARTVISAYNQELITPRDLSYFLSGLRIQHFDYVEKWCFS
jgi:Zn-dependent peptidase ImmA (M78 family)/DNA-binding XRE family transcriptional regulator